PDGDLADEDRCGVGRVRNVEDGEACVRRVDDEEPRAVRRKADGPRLLRLEVRVGGPRGRKRETAGQGGTEEAKQRRHETARERTGAESRNPSRSARQRGMGGIVHGFVKRAAMLPPRPDTETERARRLAEDRAGGGIAGQVDSG